MTAARTRKNPRSRASAAKRKATPADVRSAIAEQPLIGLVAAAKILGVAAPNVSRLRASGEMPPGIEVEGTAMVYIKSEVEALARKLAADRNGA